MNTETKMRLPSLKAVLLIGLAIFVVGYVAAAKPDAQEETPEFGVCAECHEDVAKIFASKPHARQGSCTACHGDADTHLSEGGGLNIFAFKDTDIPNVKSEKCTSCHTKTNSKFFASPHGKAAMDCTTCHMIHSEETKPFQLKTSSVKNCYSCHQDVFSEFQLNERHRLQEGILECTTCHDPHVPATRERLSGFNNEACIRCHTDKGGPFLHEHEASRIEGCRSCHVVHGSPNRHMLTHHSISDLCFSCHTMAPSFHSRFTSEGTNCTTCHATIHGSNLDRLFLK